MLTATIVVLTVVLLAAVVLLVVASAQHRRGSGRVTAGTGVSVGATPGARVGPALGSPAQVWLERGERVAARLRQLGAQHPALTGAGDDADAVLAELRAAAAEVAALDTARARLPMSTLRAEQDRLDAAITAGGAGAADLRTAREAVAARLTLAAQHRAAADALLARMRAAVAGLEHAEDELSGLLAAPSEATPSATAELTDRLAGLRVGLAEVRAISVAAGSATPEPPEPGAAGTPTPGAEAAREQSPRGDQGLPGDVPGSVEGPPRT